MQFKKYQWNSEKLKKRAKIYDYMMLLNCVVVVACLYMLPENYKVVNIPFIVVAFIMWLLSQRTQSKDKKLKTENKGG